MSNEITRRHALTRIGQSVTASALMPTLFTQLALDARAAGRGGRSGRKLILLWLEGGPSQMETFDPKQGHANGGPFAAIPTSVQGWNFCETLPGLAKRAEQLAVIRSMTSKEGNHSRARELVKTGYVPNPSVSFPSLGSIVSSELAAQDFDLPSYIQVNGAPSPSGSPSRA